MWAADTGGVLLEIDEETLEITGSWPIGAAKMIGVAVDFEGYVWTVSQEEGATYKFDPETHTMETVEIGLEPYTYSDMTGVQLENVTLVE